MNEQFLESFRKLDWDSRKKLLFSFMKDNHPRTYKRWVEEEKLWKEGKIKKFNSEGNVRDFSSEWHPEEVNLE